MQPSPPELADATTTLTGIDRPPPVQASAPIGGPDSSAQDRVPRSLAWLYTIAGSVGFAAAFTLLIEKIELLKDPTYVPSCSINPILSCGSVMQTEQAEAFGFPNPIIGVVGFAIIITAGMALLAGAEFHRWFWSGLQVGVTFAVIFVHWLILQSLYRIDALCPYCMVVWVVTIPLFWYTTLHSLRVGHLGPRAADSAVKRTLAEYHGVVLTIWYLAIAALIAQRFWDYWSSLLS
ncbi:MAG: vitamin K epoxide reductase family protein [Acidimicrobiia bacterium]